ncbi:MAG TPA: amidohydrolase family protein [Saprospiraceae bacterium]|nr:amidohydrolase family protein [Saprospiraceae bacterium]
MMKITADKVLTLDPQLQGHDWILHVKDNGNIEGISSPAEVDMSDVKHYNGILCPGFVNTHCHLELSHLREQIPTGTRLIPFITGIVEKRDFPPEVIAEKMIEADRAMYEAGINAVGDISNVSDSFKVKAESPIYYHSFLELFDLMQEDKAEEHFQGGVVLYEKAKEMGLSASLTPHAPYSVSDQLFQSITGVSQHLSIHNQETADEDELFEKGTGGFHNFYGHFGLNLDGFNASGKSSLRSVLPHVPSETPTLFIHNSFTQPKDIAAATEKLEKVYWCTCPNANLYIENRLPNYQFFLDAGAKMVIGTDSLSSNWQLSVLEEIKTIRRYFSALDSATLLNWACRNGAEALGVEDRYGVFKEGRQPGVLHVTTDEQGEIGDESEVKRLF